MWHQFSTLAKEPPSRLSPPRTRGAPSRIPSLGRCGGLLAPCLTHPLAQRSRRGGRQRGRTPRGSVEVQDWGPGRLRAAPNHLLPGDAPAAGRVAAQRSGTSLPGRPHRGVCHVCQLVPGPRQHPLEILFLETGEALALPPPPPRAAVSPTPAAQPGCQPANYSRPDRLALCLGSNEIPAPAMCQQEQRRVLCSGEDAGAAQLGWKGSVGLEGQCGAGRTVGPSQKQGARRRVRRAPCGEAGMQELSLVSLASRASEGPCCLFGPAL